MVGGSGVPCAAVLLVCRYSWLLIINNNDDLGTIGRGSFAMEIRMAKRRRRWLCHLCVKDCRDVEYKGRRHDGGMRGIIVSSSHSLYVSLSRELEDSPHQTIGTLHTLVVHFFGRQFGRMCLEFGWSGRLKYQSLMMSVSKPWDTHHQDYQYSTV